MTDFLTQFQHLLKEKPRYNLKIVNCENCDFADTALNSRNCYYCFGAFHAEDLLYSRYSRDCSSSSDLTFCFNCEWCYECIGCSKCYSVDYCKYVSNCSDCQFCQDCIGCANCFGCLGLSHKQYCFFNEQLSKDEYEKRTAAFDLSKQSDREEVAKRIEQIKNTRPQLAIHQTMTEDCIGDNLVQAKNCYNCFDAYDLEDCNFCIETNSLKNCTDMTVCFRTEESYQCIHSPGNYNCNFCFHVDYSSDSEFCAYSRSLKNCFGCVYLQNKEYHILNQPYAPEEYFRKVAEIKSQLQSIGMYNLLPYFASEYEWGRMGSETESVVRELV